MKRLNVSFQKIQCCCSQCYPETVTLQKLPPELCFSRADKGSAKLYDTEEKGTKTQS